VGRGVAPGVVCPIHETCVLGTCHIEDTSDPMFCDETTCDGGAPPMIADAGRDATTHAPADASDAGDASSPLPCPGAEKTPALVTNGAGTAYNLVTSSTNLFWADTIGGTVRSIAKTGGAMTLWASGQDTPAFVAWDSADLSWTSNVGLYAATTPGAGVKLVPQTMDLGGGPVTADPSGGVYWFNVDTGQIVFTKSGGSGVVTRTLTTGAGIYASAIAFDGTDVYFSNRTGTQGLMKVPASATAVAPTLVAPITAPLGLAVDAFNAYVASADGTVTAYRKDGTMMPKTLASGQSSPTSIAVRGPYVYVANLGPSPTFAGSVVRIPTTPGFLKTIKTGRSPTAIAVDARCVYWHFRDLGEIWRASL
jgi:hypothetical protein